MCVFGVWTGKASEEVAVRCGSDSDAWCVFKGLNKIEIY